MSLTDPQRKYTFTSALLLGNMVVQNTGDCFHDRFNFCVHIIPFRNLRWKNILLEEKVMHRTKELKHSLEELRSTNSNLSTRRKWLRLEVRRAGIAHEIQNL
jgi:hypothetical protein